MITVRDNVFLLDTAHTTYAFGIMETGQLQHYYYGNRIDVADVAPMEEKHAFPPGNTVAYDQDHMEFTLEDVCLETSAYGKGDIREPMMEVICSDGSSTLDFVYDNYCVAKGKEPFETLPGSYDEAGNVDHLTVVMKDKSRSFTLELHYFVYEDTDVITRSAKFINDSDEKIQLRRMMSFLIDFDRTDFVVSTFKGAWIKEMKKVDTKLSAGKFVNSSYTGTSSNRNNPLVLLSREETSENYGECYGFNLIYSGNHYEAVEVSGFDKTRVVAGINPTNFGFWLDTGDVFEAPEIVMTYSDKGFGGMSRHMHDFVNNHIVRGKWKGKERPVLLNSWEASYFDISEASLLKLAKAGKDVGIELFVVDDGWFGTRDDDTQALGDWWPNLKKLPGGLTGLAKKINDMGLEFGIWIEPEMVSVNSDLYRAHPDWSIEIPGKNHSEGRNQRLLDFSNPAVVEYITGEITNVLSSANISYVKWDMNRIFSDYYSQYLKSENQQELGHRYMMGVYRLMDALVTQFPEILFEGCAAGGNRFDLGALCYFPQIWASDNTDSVSRLSIQNGYSYGYPQSVVSAHVSACPNHQTLRTTSIDSRFNVAAFGILGYECNLVDAKKEELEAIKEQIELYKKYRRTLQHGDFYRGCDGNIVQWTCVSKDQSQAIGMIYQKMVQPNEMYHVYRAAGLKEDARYHFFGRKLKHNIKAFGDLVNTMAPVHIKPDSLVHNTLAKFIKMDGETEDCVSYGNSLMHQGVKLKQAFVATGYSDQVRYFPDYASRMYFMEEVGEQSFLLPDAQEEPKAIEDHA